MGTTNNTSPNICPAHVKSIHGNQYHMHVLKNLENIRISTLEVLESDGVITLLDQYMERLNIVAFKTQIENFFKEIADISLQELIFSRAIEDLLNTDDDRIKKKLQNFIFIAFMDIFHLVALQINSGIPKQEIKRLVHKNMKYGGGGQRTIADCINKTHYSKAEDHWQRIVDKIKTNSQMNLTEILGDRGVSPEGMPMYRSIDDLPPWMVTKRKKETSCPFGLIVGNDEWIDTIWSFIETQLIPKLQDRIPPMIGEEQDFFTGRMHIYE